MKRKIKNLTDWKTFEKKLLKSKSFKKVADSLEPEYILADSLIKARRRQKLTQSDLARKIGTKQPVISRLETASSRPSLTLLKRIAEVLDTRLTIKFG